MLDRSKGPERPAEIRYLPGEFQVLKPGSFVVCAVTGARIPIEDLRYWSAEFQEAYASADAANERYAQLGVPRA